MKERIKRKEPGHVRNRVLHFTITDCEREAFDRHHSLFNVKNNTQISKSEFIRTLIREKLK